MQGLRAKNHVHIGRALDDVIAFLRSHTAAYANHQVRILCLERNKPAKMAEYFVFGFFAYRAGVKQNHIGFIHIIRLCHAIIGMQHIRHA